MALSGEHMDDKKREQLERKYRPHLFENCIDCGEESVRIAAHICDPVRRKTYHATFLPPSPVPDEETVKRLEDKLLEVLLKHRIVITSAQLRDLALAVEPLSRGGWSAGVAA
jgi:hypothetical protein